MSHGLNKTEILENKLPYINEFIWFKLDHVETVSFIPRKEVRVGWGYQVLAILGPTFGNEIYMSNSRMI